MDNRTFEQYFDHEVGLLCTWDGTDFDGGDSAQKTGLYRFGRYIKFQKDADQLGREQGKYAQELDMLESKDQKGWYVRSPAIGRKWWSDRYTFSRDQQRSIVMAMGALKQTKRLYRIAWEHIKRVGFYQNFYSIDRDTTILPNIVIRAIPSLKGFKAPDIAAPDHVGEYIRAFFMAGQWQFGLLYPILLIADLIKLLSLPISFKQWQNPDEADDDNMIMSILQAKMSLPTPFSFLIRKIYKYKRPIAGYIDETKTVPLSLGVKQPGPQSAIAWKHRAPGAPPFINLYGPILDEKL